MSIEQWIGVLLGGGVFGSLVSWLTTRHRPKVDTAQVVLTGSDKLIDQLQEERNRLDARIDDAIERATTAEERAIESERNSTYLAAALARITDHHLVVVRGVADGTVPPWPPVPPGQNWLSPEDYPPVNPPHTDQE